MEVREYMESGILELYVLNALDPTERAEVYNMAKNHAEIRDELSLIEQTLSRYAEDQAVVPSAGLYERTAALLTFKDEETSIAADARKPADRTTTLPIPMYPVKFYAYALAACFTLLLVSTYGLYNLWTELGATRQKLSELTAQNRVYGSQIAYLKNEQKTSRSLIDDPDFKKLALLGTPAHPSQRAVVFWNKKRHTVLIDPAGLANTDRAHSYQLWAIVKGKPVDAGVFEVKGDLNPISQLKDISTAQAFAVTLEPHGGSKQPTMTAMYVMAAI